MSIWPNAIMTPLHVHGARTAAEYRAKQRKFIAANKAALPAMNWRDPFVSTDRPDVLIAGGKWLVQCACGNYPSVDPAIGLACCFECGAVYEHLAMPADANEIETVLTKRAHPSHRAWLPGETVDDLRRENAARGVR